MNDLIAQLIVVGRKAVASGLVIGSGGNLSARLPGADECVVTCSGSWLDELTPEQFSVVAIADGTVRGGHPAPSSEVPLHLATYRARPDANALIHLHPQTSVLLDALGYPIRLLTTDQAYYVREVRSTPFLQSGTPELAQAGADAVADGCNCVILGHHGCSVIADTIELAHKRAANLEEAARATLTMLQLGDTTSVCPPAYLETIRAQEAAAQVGH
ncbi:MAG: class II aldolase/adducin family protein [Actinobacteria bacterium]|nr:class II aldolase/adducin family protein [Actinomycetota bacterium]MBW3646925.1 class II aldolase/adducin family protein [Actinomycetota bacterium]MDQ3612008.1 class II aldolase/adducin family protein [Actinomycetota bacterium]